MTELTPARRRRRNRIAIAALQGMLAHPTRYRPRAGSSCPENWHEAIAEEALQIAEALEKRMHVEGDWVE